MEKDKQFVSEILKIIIIMIIKNKATQTKCKGILLKLFSLLFFTENYTISI